MFKTNLPPDSSWKWEEVKTYEVPLPTGRYVLVDDYKKLETIVNQLKMDEAAAMALCMGHEGRIEHLTKMVQYQHLYIQYLIGGMPKEEFKKCAKEFAEPLDINEAIKKAKKEVDTNHDIFEGANDIEGVILFLRSEIDKITKERDQAVEFLAMRMENLKENGKTILDFQAVWIQQANSRNNKLQIKVVELEKKLSECEKLKQGYYEEAVGGWKKVRDMEREAETAKTCVKKEGS